VQVHVISEPGLASVALVDAEHARDIERGCANALDHLATGHRVHQFE
jgi:hypothetical protein